MIRLSAAMTRWSGPSKKARQWRRRLTTEADDGSQSLRSAGELGPARGSAASWPANTSGSASPSSISWLTMVGCHLQSGSMAESSGIETRSTARFQHCPMMGRTHSTTLGMLWRENKAEVSFLAIVTVMACCVGGSDEPARHKVRREPSSARKIGGPGMLRRAERARKPSDKIVRNPDRSTRSLSPTTAPQDFFNSSRTPSTPTKGSWTGIAMRTARSRSAASNRVTSASKWMTWRAR